MRSTELVASSTLSSASSSSSASSLSASNSIASSPATFHNSTAAAADPTTAASHLSALPTNSTNSPDITNSRNHSNSANKNQSKTAQSSSILSHMAHSTKAPPKLSSNFHLLKKEISSRLNDSLQDSFKVDMSDEMFSEPMDILDDTDPQIPPHLAGHASNNQPMHKFFRNLASSNDQAVANDLSTVHLHHDFYREFGDIFDDDDLD